MDRSSESHRLRELSGFTVSLRPGVSFSFELFLFPLGVLRWFLLSPQKQSCLALLHYFWFVNQLSCLSSVAQDRGGTGAGNDMPSILHPVHSGWNRVWGDTQKLHLYKEAKAAGCFLLSGCFIQKYFITSFFPVGQSYTSLWSYQASKGLVMGGKKREELKGFQKNYYLNKT